MLNDCIMDNNSDTGPKDYAIMQHWGDIIPDYGGGIIPKQTNKESPSGMLHADGCVPAALITETCWNDLMFQIAAFMFQIWWKGFVVYWFKFRHTHLQTDPWLTRVLWIQLRWVDWAQDQNHFHWPGMWPIQGIYINIDIYRYGILSYVHDVGGYYSI